MKITDIEERLRCVEDSLGKAKSELNVINKVFWIALSAFVTGGIAMMIFGNGLSML
jgi:hypothetical protein